MDHKLEIICGMWTAPLQMTVSDLEVCFKYCNLLSLIFKKYSIYLYKTHVELCVLFPADC